MPQQGEGEREDQGPRQGAELARGKKIHHGKAVGEGRRAGVLKISRRAGAEESKGRPHGLPFFVNSAYVYRLRRIIRPFPPRRYRSTSKRLSCRLRPL
ncbi:hypothetical protein EH55_05985 [Synergistes jonesii]|uniref:Uncharacterized protein n=1 Tax=Synergistes jonesii TaxID=2754 RepID=A0A073J2K3_9BACT|nr:hypothetical protein EH55_05985 [Synergistes jonesii]